ncbi:DNA topoisomerase 6 subunit B-like [Solanum verrucosum]|uniref:DNA topoisomerase 6 subunit B-like n=1 Tax=Solanum verrucosum TaxID=315347 RepID=UPI0020D1B786|nr:DNA topoisomerase 6 subunit B-like [Solanum verrucosum]
MIGLADHERRDEALYDDFETAKAREKRLAKEARVLEIQAKNVALGKKVKDPAATKAAKGREASYYRVTCKDNGRGMQHDDILNMFGRGLHKGYGCRIDVEFSASLALLEHVIEATKYFIIIGGFSMRQYISELMPLIVEALLDWVAITKYELDVSTFGQVVLSTG